MTKRKPSVEQLLRGAGIRRGSGDYEDYELAKRIIFKGKQGEGRQYERLNQIIQKYLRL